MDSFNGCQVGLVCETFSVLHHFYAWRWRVSTRYLVAENGTVWRRGSCEPRHQHRRDGSLVRMLLSIVGERCSQKSLVVVRETETLLQSRTISVAR